MDRKTQQYNAVYRKAYDRAVAIFDATPYADSYASAYADAVVRGDSDAQAALAAEDFVARLDSPVVVHA